jgi:steroid delta-isomerase-like uncharacterized protein
MSASDTIRRGIAAVNRGDAAGFASVFAADAVIEDPQYPEPLVGREAIEKDMHDFLVAFPDLHIELRSLVEGETLCAFEATMRGTHLGPMAMPDGVVAATGRRVESRVAMVIRTNAEGLTVEERRYYDLAGILDQLGLAGPGSGPPMPVPTI